jgi:C1A family cysteine protease
MRIAATLLTIVSALVVAGSLYHLATSAKGPVGENALDTRDTALWDAWMHWKKQNNRQYLSSVEHDYRFSVFKNNKKRIVDHYALAGEERTYTLGLTLFADLTEEEFKAQYLGLKQTAARTLKVQKLSGAVPDAVNWRDAGAVTGVKNQGSCGSCWAFSAVGALEGLNYQNNKSLLSFSEQQLVDCEKQDQGCNGGLMENAFSYVKQNGITLEGKYPYKGRDQTCAYDVKDSAFKIADFVEVPHSDQDALKAASAQQVVSVGVSAGGIFQLYFGGVLNIKWLCPGGIDHGVTLVGYGHQFFGGDYWLVKNSWGGFWGESGYIKLGRTTGTGRGQCGITEQASYPTA